MKRKLYIRYKEIPSNNKSGIYNGDKKIGEEIGVSVWNAKYKRGRWFPVLPKRITKFTLDDFSGMMQCYSTVLLVSAKEIGKGSDGEPVVRNIKVKKRLKRYSREEFDKIIPRLYKKHKHYE